MTIEIPKEVMVAASDYSDNITNLPYRPAIQRAFCMGAISEAAREYWYKQFVAQQEIDIRGGEPTRGGDETDY